MDKPLYEPQSDWSFSLISKIYDACEEIAINELGCDCYINQLEVVTFENVRCLC